MSGEGISVQDLDGCLITIKYEGRAILLVVLARDGTINRAGEGTVSGDASTLFIGRVDGSLFDELLEAVSPEVLQLGGRYEADNRQGGDAELQLVLSAGDRGVVIEHLYGAESAGPPEEVRAVVEKAVALTDPWWRQQLVAARRPRWWGLRRRRPPNPTGV